MLLRVVIVMVVVSATAMSWAMAQGSIEAKLQIEVENGLLSVDLRNVAMSDVLQIIGEQAGVKVSICGTLDKVKGIAFTNKPLEGGIRALAEASDVDFIMIYGPRRRLTEVRAYNWPVGPPPTPPPLHIPIPGTKSLPAKHK